MAARGDERVGAAIAGALREGPRDVLGLLEALRDRAGDLLTGREGALHALLHRQVRTGRVLPVGRTPQGLTRYGLVALPEAPFAAALGEGEEIPPAADPASARGAARVAGAVRDPGDRGRVLADVLAHLEALRATGQQRAFGSVRAVRQLLARIDRGRPTVCFPAGPADHVRRFLLHEGPWILAAILLFLLVRHFVAEVFRIPSESMVPTLLEGDRVVVVKLGSEGKAPRRWEVATFRLRGRVIVKRAVGIGPESFALHGGDAYADGRLLVKPDAVREALRLPWGAWDWGPEAPEGWVEEEGPPGLGRWRLAAPVLWSQGPGPSHEGDRDVPLRDVYLTLGAERAAGGVVGVELLREGEGAAPALLWRLVLGPEATRLLEIPAGAPPGEARVLAQGPPASGEVRLELSSVDGILRARVGEALSFEAAREAPGGPAVPALLVGEGARLRRLVLEKDIHYTLVGEMAVPPPGSRSPPGSYAADLAPGQTFFLGDNTYRSRDSRRREVGAIPAADLIGPVLIRLLPPTRIGPVR